MKYVRALVVTIAAVLAWSGAPLAGEQGVGQQLQLALQEANNVAGSIDVEVFKLKRLLATPESKDQAKQRIESVNRLKSLAASLNRSVKKIDQLVVKQGVPAAGRRIVEGYSAEFYAGTRLELAQALNSFPLKAGPEDGTAMDRLSTAAGNVRKGAQGMRRQLEESDKAAPSK